MPLPQLRRLALAQGFVTTLTFTLGLTLALTLALVLARTRTRTRGHLLPAHSAPPATYYEQAEAPEHES